MIASEKAGMTSFVRLEYRNWDAQRSKTENSAPPAQSAETAIIASQAVKSPRRHSNLMVVPSAGPRLVLLSLKFDLAPKPTIAYSHFPDALSRTDSDREYLQDALARWITHPVYTYPSV